MATTTVPYNHHRYQDYTAAAAIAERRDYMTQESNYSIRQTMTTVGSSDLERRSRLVDSSGIRNVTPNTSSKSVPTAHEDPQRRQQRPVEEQAALLRMQEEESFVLQGGRLPKKLENEFPPGTDNGEFDLQALPYPNNNNAEYARTYSQQQQQQPRRGRYPQQPPPNQRQPYLSRHLYSPYHQQEEEHSFSPRYHHHHNRDNLSEHHQPGRRDIPLELNIPPCERGNNCNIPLYQREIEFNPDLLELPRSNHSGDRHRPAQLRHLARQPHHHYLNSGQLPRHNPYSSSSPTREEYPLLQPNMMVALERGIHGLEVAEGGGGERGHPYAPQYARRTLPKDYDAILVVGGGEPHGRHRDYNYHPCSSGGREQDHRHYHPNSPPPPSSPALPPTRHYADTALLDRYQGWDGDALQHRPPQQPHVHARPLPHPHPHHGGEYNEVPPARLMFPVEWVEFPKDWDGREIESTEDGELLDREEDEYYFRRRLAAYRQQPQPQPHLHPQHALQSLQSQSFQTQSTSQSLSQSFPRNNNNRSPTRRGPGNVSRDSAPNGPQQHPSLDVCSQTVLQNGRRMPMEIEISPGVSMPFRGSEETWEAIALNRIVRTSCMGCSVQLYCVEDAKLVVCPDCQTMSPAHETEDPDVILIGLGLGFKEEQLIQWRDA